MRACIFGLRVKVGKLLQCVMYPNTSYDNVCVNKIDLAI